MVDPILAFVSGNLQIRITILIMTMIMRTTAAIMKVKKRITAAGL